MPANPKNEYLRRAAWYVEHIDALSEVLAKKDLLDGDDVEQCRAMLREIMARFRADQRMPPPGQFPSTIENDYRLTITAANEALRIPAGSRPIGRWKILLADCRAHFDRYATDSVAPAHHGIA